jgi:hypothetical protein
MTMKHEARKQSGAEPVLQELERLWPIGAMIRAKLESDAMRRAAAFRSPLPVPYTAHDPAIRPRPRPCA